MIEEIPLKFKLECLVLSSGSPLSIKEAARLLGNLSLSELMDVVAELNAQNVEEGRSFTIEERGDSFVARTRQSFTLLVQQLRQNKKRLSHSLLQTLAIVAYKPSITKAEIERMRGIDSSYAISKLIELDLIRISGRARKPGRPLLYKTTKRFLLRFGLKSLEDLPDVDELKEMMSTEGEGI